MSSFPLSFYCRVVVVEDRSLVSTAIMTSQAPLSEVPSNEKVDATNVPEIPKEPQVKKKGFFSKRSNDSASVDEKNAEVPTEKLGDPAKKKDIPPASFTSLFRYINLNHIERNYGISYFLLLGSLLGQNYS